MKHSAVPQDMHEEKLRLHDMIITGRQSRRIRCQSAEAHINKISQSRTHRLCVLVVVAHISGKLRSRAILPMSVGRSHSSSASIVLCVARSSQICCGISELFTLGCHHVLRVNTESSCSCEVCLSLCSMITDQGYYCSVIDCG
jgi:hypothetical protein